MTMLHKNIVTKQNCNSQILNTKVFFAGLGYQDLTTVLFYNRVLDYSSTQSYVYTYYVVPL